jgi:hypothetical protein
MDSKTSEDSEYKHDSPSKASFDGYHLKAESKDSSDSDLYASDAKSSGRAGVEVEIKGSDMSVIDHAIEFCSSDHFQDTIKEFQLKHCNVFEDLSESKHPEDEEQSLEFTSLFEDYNSLLDDLLTNQFLRKHDYSSIYFYAACKDIIDGKFVALFEEHENLWFVEMLMGMMEYKHFVRQMVSLAKARSETMKALQGGNLRMRKT